MTALLSPVSSLPSPEQPARRGNDTRQLQEAGQEFEALLVSQLLKSARAGGGGWMGTGKDPSSDSLMGFAEEQLAQVMASGGGLGLTRMVAEGLEKAETAERGSKSSGAGR